MPFQPHLIAEAGPFRIFKVAPTVWAIYQGESFRANARKTDAARYGVAFTNAGAASYACALDAAQTERKACAKIDRAAKVAAGIAKRQARQAEAARSPALPL